MGKIRFDPFDYAHAGMQNAPFNILDRIGIYSDFSAAVLQNRVLTLINGQDEPTTLCEQMRNLIDYSFFVFDMQVQ